MEYSRELTSCYAYTYVSHEEEAALCRLELRTLFGVEPNSGCIVTPILIDPSRSPFIKQRIEVLYQGASIQEIADQASSLELQADTFKVQYVPIRQLVSIPYEEERAVERQIGARIRGKAEMRKPDIRFGVLRTVDGVWLFGDIQENEAVWLLHKEKPRQYSTALTTRMARAVVNIAIPGPLGVKAIDPCCGIGTIVLEALSMGMDMIGSDVNPLAVAGARMNLAHFGYPNVVLLQDMREITDRYDVAVLDLPYNLCSVLSEAEQREMLGCTRRLASRAVIIATQPIDTEVEHAGFRILDRCTVRKGSVIRQVILGE